MEEKEPNDETMKENTNENENENGIIIGSINDDEVEEDTCKEIEEKKDINAENSETQDGKKEDSEVKEDKKEIEEDKEKVKDENKEKEGQNEVETDKDKQKEEEKDNDSESNKEKEEKEDNDSEEKKENEEEENKDKENDKDNEEEENKDKEEEEEEEKKPKERSVYSLEGAKQPISMYTRRVMDISNIGKYLNPDSTAGRCGGHNLGNTCFMNSSIACLSNCTELTYYFLKGDYKRDINEENNLGMRGDLAKSWGELLHQYWVEDTRVGDPSDFKSTIGRKAVRFRGYGQQDSNEFMSVFLDYLNEDLNRTTKKQYIEMKEKGKDESDEDCAKRYWDCNLKRNDSIITDLFCGQFKSTITCPDCGFINITFDPFETLNLPMLSQRRSRSSMWDIINFDYYYVPKYGLRKSYHIIIKNFLENTMFGSVIDRIKKDKDCPIHDKLDNALIVDMYNNKIYGNASNTNEVRQLNSHGEYIVGYPYNKNEDKMQIPVFFYSKEYSNDKENMSFYPRMIFDKSDMTVGDLKKKIYFNLRKYILSPFLKDNEEKDNVSLEIEKYMQDDKYELDDNKLYELIEKEYQDIFINYQQEDEEEEEKKEEEKNEEEKKESEQKSDEDEEKKEEEGKEDEAKEEENKEEEKKEEEKKEEEKKEDEKNEEEKKEEEKKEEEKKEEEKKEDEKKEDENKEEEKKENEKKEEEKKEDEKKDEKPIKEKSEAEICIENFRKDMPFSVFIIYDRDYNNEVGKIPFVDGKNFTRLSSKFKENIKLNSFDNTFENLDIDLTDYQIIVEFNEESKYINKEAFDLNSFEKYEMEFTIKKEEQKKKDDEEEDDGKMTLRKCIKKFCKEEQLEEGDEWYCSSCKKHVLAKKKMELYYLPKILIICFKRFVKDSYRWEKNEDNIDFPIDDMDMSEFVIGPDKDHSKYDLFAVSQHYGSTGFGHYTAVCKNNGQWFSYDDSSCSETNANSALTSAAYVLFYRRQTD